MLIACYGLRAKPTRNEWCEGCIFHLTDTLVIFPLFHFHGYGSMLLMGLLNWMGRKG